MAVHLEIHRSVRQYCRPAHLRPPYERQAKDPQAFSDILRCSSARLPLDDPELAAVGQSGLVARESHCVCLASVQPTLLSCVAGGTAQRRASEKLERC
jgi:hypothetical protein